MNKPASIPASKPIHGLAFPIPRRVSAAWVTAAAVKAPASIFPSRAILITPDRSENRPPSAASTSGVASRIVEARSEIVKISLINLGSNCSRESSAYKPLKESLSSYEEDDDALQHLHDILCYIFRKTVHVDPAML